MNPVEFLQLLWGDTPPRGLIQLWWLDGRRSQYLVSPAGAGGLEGAVDVYTGVALAHKDHGRKHRAKNEQAAGIAGLWCDVDVNGGPTEKTGCAPSKLDAIGAAYSILSPTIIVDSGYGVHAWWLFDTPWRFTSLEQQQTAALMSAQWYALHRAAASADGWSIDHTHDLARLLRLPGTVNGKGDEQVPVTVADHDGNRYPRGQLQDLAAQAGPQLLASQPAAAADGETPDLIARTESVAPTLKLDALRENVPEFALTFDHQRTDATGWSLSEYDMSLATQMVQAAFTDQEIADVLAYHRHIHTGGADTKGKRVDYLRRTIAKARARSERDTAAQRMHTRTRKAAA